MVDSGHKKKNKQFFDDTEWPTTFFFGMYSRKHGIGVYRV